MTKPLTIFHAYARRTDRLLGDFHPPLSDLLLLPQGTESQFLGSYFGVIQFLAFYLTQRPRTQRNDMTFSKKLSALWLIMMIEHFLKLEPKQKNMLPFVGKWCSYKIPPVSFDRKAICDKKWEQKRLKIDIHGMIQTQQTNVPTCACLPLSQLQ